MFKKNLHIVPNTLRNCGPHSTPKRVPALHSAAPGSIPGIPKDFSEEVFWEGKNCLDEKNCWCCQA